MSSKGLIGVFLSGAGRAGPLLGILPSDLLILRWWGGECHLNGRGALVGARGQPEVSRAQEPAGPIPTARHPKCPAPTSEGERDSSLKDIT